MKKSLALMLALSAVPSIVPAQWGDGTWFGKTTVDTGNLDMTVQSFRSAVPMVSLQNRSDRPARCSATFSNGLQFSETRSTSIAPGKKATLGVGMPYITAKVDIDVKCRERTTG